MDNKKNKYLEDNDFLKKIDFITSASKFGFFFEDLENNILQATEQLLSISNLPNLTDSKEADKLFAERIDSKYRSVVLAKIEQFYNGDIENVSESFQFHRTSEQIIWLHLNIIAEKRDAKTNKPIKIIGYHQDVTSQKEIEIKLQHSAKLESIGLMASEIAHEINNPLTIIAAHNQKIKKAIESISNKETDTNEIKEDVLRNIAKIESTTKRISKIIQGIKNFSRDSSNEKFEKIDLNIFIEELTFFIENRLKQANIILLIENETQNLKIRCRPIALSQVFINLINNSIDAIENMSDKWIKLSIQVVENEFIFKIIDSGKGIDVNIREKIMSPFFTTKETGKGTGIGLGISSSIIKNHNGKLFLEKKSINTTFVIQIPIDNDSAD